MFQIDALDVDARLVCYEHKVDFLKYLCMFLL